MKIMAVDLGDAHTGLAACDRTEFMASPIGTIHDRSMESVLQKVVIAAQEYDIGAIVVGHPVNMDGSLGPRAQKSAAFAEELRGRVPLPVVLWDERLTTVAANGILAQNEVRGKKRKETVDEVAAALILENFMAWRQNHPGSMPSWQKTEG